MVEFRHSRSAYYAEIRNIIDDIIMIKLDTGATNTVISYEMLTRETTAFPKDISKLTDDEKNTIRRSIERKNRFVERLKDKYEVSPFHSASGTPMYGVLSCAKNISLSGHLLKVPFYYYLILGIESPLALLGDDFIGCCDFSHKVNGNIKISYIDEQNYNNSKDRKEVLELAELNELLKI